MHITCIRHYFKHFIGVISFILDPCHYKLTRKNDGFQNWRNLCDDITLVSIGRVELHPGLFAPVITRSVNKFLVPICPIAVGFLQLNVSHIFFKTGYQSPVQGLSLLENLSQLSKYLLFIRFTVFSLRDVDDHLVLYNVPYYAPII